ncbi:hypothetical protein [Bifidobacterium crudilactis]|uniref:hypothetical protein n=1 Tax=Bifidobacterium crudilactis TaxID=327277 RepID=UPI0026480C41|nr:hypothetical protein [Bifidobacterium crudilactis]MDN5971837.1 DUF1523 family protein [Bifidobacterium crudilactis]MDN6001143.1 DUF1523 family protein [Bifidobacterium crudilactis]MDN6466681.1 DUF1523 family protein [Bifidobacterium crudilactis]MDN6558098.1 DUF1523 family protein [Bifidobacterium crudilactis]MDN6773452.1 DUF1523 family protein [Bifidobacterium crudilactis]
MSKGKKSMRSVLAVIVGVLLLPVLASCSVPNTQTHTGCVVTDKDRTSTSDGGSDMRVYSSCGTFQVADELLVGRFDSADVYAQIEVGRTYTFETGWWRIDWMSRFPNILSVKEVQQ